MTNDDSESVFICVNLWLELNPESVDSTSCLRGLCVLCGSQFPEPAASLGRNPVPVAREEAGLADVVQVEYLLREALGADCQPAVRRHTEPEDFQVALKARRIHAP